MKQRIFRYTSEQHTYELNNTEEKFALDSFLNVWNLEVEFYNFAT